VTARSGHIGRALRGNEATHVLVDEAAYVPEELVTEVAMPMLATNNGRLTLISTPNGLNHFWRFFKMGELCEHGVWSRTAPSSESPHVSKEFLDIQRKLISQRAFEIEYEAQFVDASGTMFGAEMVESCIVPEVHRSEDCAAIGVDWGRYRDYTAVAVLQGGSSAAQLVAVQQFNKASWQEMVDRAIGIAKSFPAAKVIADGTGNGDAVCEMFEKGLGRTVEVHSFTNTSKRKLIEGLRAGMERRAIAIPPEPELIRQLKHFEVALSTSGSQLMNAKSGYHDDLVIALALAYSITPADYSAPILVGDSRSFSDPRKLCFDDLDWSKFRP
jgi:phage FluMu gp28-like protein